MAQVVAMMTSSTASLAASKLVLLTQSLPHLPTTLILVNLMLPQCYCWTPSCCDALLLLDPLVLRCIATAGPPDAAESPQSLLLNPFFATSLLLDLVLL